MTIVNASGATEAVNITLVSDQFAFSARDPGGNNSTTLYSWLTTGADDVQVNGSGIIDFNSSPANFGLANSIDIDLSNNNFFSPDVRISGITAQYGAGFLADARVGIITDGPVEFFNELMSFNDTMTGSAFDDTFKGGGGADTLNMGGGNDSAFGGDGNDALRGDAGDDSLFGDAGDDALFGGAGEDTLNGGTGADVMDGGFSDDIYIVDNANDVAAEVASGVDLVQASVSHTLSVNLENLTLTGTGSINGTGNAKANVITGNSGNNSLQGLAGNDTISGGGGADRLDGGTGADVMSGGAGNDTYIVDNVLDVVSEGLGQGTDSVQSSVSFTLPANVENLTLTGGAAINGTGNALANTITGNLANNILIGSGGNDLLRGGSGGDTLNGGTRADHLNGGLGRDVLIGGTGADVFDFNATADSNTAAAQRDVINGFDNPGGAFGDLIDLETIDANNNAMGNQTFNFLGVIQNPFPPVTPAGSLWLRNEGGETIVHANVDGDNAPEMSIRIADGAVSPFAYSAADFIL
jgi:Ca2+-binding RTX toxin-like protein